MELIFLQYLQPMFGKVKFNHSHKHTSFLFISLVWLVFILQYKSQHKFHSWRWNCLQQNGPNNPKGNGALGFSQTDTKCSRCKQGKLSGCSPVYEICKCSAVNSSRRDPVVYGPKGKQNGECLNVVAIYLPQSSPQLIVKTFPIAILFVFIHNPTLQSIIVLVSCTRENNNIPVIIT